MNMLVCVCERERETERETEREGGMERHRERERFVHSFVTLSPQHFP